ncbi:MAG: DNA polymerase III subunit gamma/tau, partial [Candidatus Tectomicrobia bacterium]|nr:DNA polymerase III subunit gamma/tau [Candidatus Tectomicrobia bacterium]
MAFIGSARKWRPQRFEELIGQDHIRRTLSNGLAAGRVAAAYLFSGTRGVGKTTTARILAKALNCESSDKPVPEPCGACASCGEIARGAHPDILEIDGATYTGVDNVRELQEKLQFRPLRGRYKVIIIDEVHQISRAAFNALLKTLEEPPGHVLFALATTEPQRVPETVRSRCQRFDFRPIPEALVVERLRGIAAAEKIGASDEALRMIARAAGGGMRDAISLLDQAATLGGGAATPDSVAEATGAVPEALAARVAEAVEARDLAGALEALAAVEAAGHDLASLGAALLDRLRGHLRRAAAGDETPLAGRRLLESIDLLVAALDRARRTPHPAALWEAAVGRLCLLGEEEDGLERLAGRLEAVAARIGAAPAPPAEPAAVRPAEGRRTRTPVGADAAPAARAAEA